MPNSSGGQLGKIARICGLAVLMIGLWGLSGCASLLATQVKSSVKKLGDDVACDKNNLPTGQVSEDQCEQVNDRIQKEFDLKEARVGFDIKGSGRLQLAGNFKNETEVERVFALTQTMVGSELVSPVKPGHIKVEAWQECLQKKLNGEQCADWDDQPYSLDKKPPGPVRNRYALIVGVGQFKNGIGPLKSAVNDAQAIADYLTDPKRGNFPRNNVTVLTDDKATRQAILTGMSDIEARVQKDDMVVVYFSSHGAPPNMFGHVNIVTYDTDIPYRDKKAKLSGTEAALQRQAVWASSIPRQRLKEFFVNMAAKDVKRTMMILDVCYSGDALKEFSGFHPVASESLAQREVTFATGYSPARLAEILGGAKDLGVTSGVRPEVINTDIESPQSHKKNKASSKSDTSSNEGWGQVIISASSEGEKSWEPGSNMSNSYFTHFFLKNLEQNKGRIQEAFSSSTPEVLDAVRQEKHTSQQPQSFALPDNNNWNFSLNAARRR